MCPCRRCAGCARRETEAGAADDSEKRIGSRDFDECRLYRPFRVWLYLTEFNKKMLAFGTEKMQTIIWNRKDADNRMQQEALNTSEQEFLYERYALMTERIAQIQTESMATAKYEDFFQKTASFLLKTASVFEDYKNHQLEKRSLEQCEADQKVLFAAYDLPQYETSYANPSYAVSLLGKEAGQLLCLLLSELEGCIACAFQGQLLELTLLYELFVQIYNAFEEDDIKEAKNHIYWYFHDYSEIFIERQLHEMLCPKENFFVQQIMQADLSDLRYLYAYGLPIGENERAVARFLQGLSQEEIQSMADTYTEGYRIGFELAGIDLTKKKTVELHCPVGFERMMRSAILNFSRMGLEPVLMREPVSSFFQKGRIKRGMYSTSLNRQYDFDHREDRAFYMDKGYASRRLEVYRTGFEKRKEAALAYAGPAVVEVFGEEPFSPKRKEEAIVLTKEQQQLQVDLTSQTGQITYTYIPGETRSFTIIAYPIPEIGENFAEIFAQTVKINTLDYKKYQKMQQSLIDVLDQAERVHILGCNDNHTDLWVQIHPLSDPAQETAFENCVADVNIPVGEVFTSPVLEGTNGVLHVTEVFLNGLQYKNLELTFSDGMIRAYTCSNFEEEADNQKYVRDNVLMHHDTLPMGEFAIGTNTTAYCMAKQYNIGAKLPILIAEKCGPHFAVGDTCYSHEEEVVRRNPDGKQIIATENSVSALRKQDPAKAYFNCHTDITIPFDELGAITAVLGDGSEVDIIRDGLFQIEGALDLNEPLLAR